MPFGVHKLSGKDGISVIVPAYNAEKTIENCIRSVLEAGDSLQELIVIDDGSTDRTAEIAGSFDGRVTVVKRKNEGVSAARNAGVELSRCRYIAFVDADDTLPPRSLDDLFAAVRSGDNDIVYGDYETCTETGDSYTSSNIPLSEEGNVLDRDLFCSLLSTGESTVVGTVWRALFKRSFIVENNINFLNGIALGEDLIFILDCLEFSPKIAYVKESVYRLNRCGQSVSVSYVSTMERDLKLVAERFAENRLFGLTDERRLTDRWLQVPWQTCCTMFKKKTPYGLVERRRKVQEVVNRYKPWIEATSLEDVIEKRCLCALKLGTRCSTLFWIVLELNNIGER